jgi:hypothetical protein
MRKLTLLACLVLLASIPLIGATVAGSNANESPDATDAARNVSLPCELVATSGLVARSSNSIQHAANVCGFVGTDVEFQSRTDYAGRVHDYAFVGTMGGGVRIFDVTTPSSPKPAGGYVDSGWQNDVQVRGDLVVSTFDGLAGEDSNASTCLKTRYPDAKGQGVDLMRLDFNEVTAKFEVNLVGCVANPPGGAHNSTIHPSGNWLAISNCCSDWALDVIDLRGVLNGATPVHRYRLVDESRATASKCPAGATFQCVVVKRADGSSASGLWDPHDVQFSRDGKTAYVAAVEATFVVDVSRVLEGTVRTVSIIDNIHDFPATLDNPENIEISHQSDVTPDGKILVVTDERGGGVTETRCNTDENGVIGGMHFFALAPIKGVSASAGASPASPKKLGSYFNPNPGVQIDPLRAWIDSNRLERGCTVHVFRIGGNGSSSPGEAARGYGGVSSLGPRELVTAWYGTGVWRVDFAGKPTSADGTIEDPRTTWGNTVAWNVMPGADTWSAKEYKGSIYAGDMLRGFDVYSFTG